MNNINTAVEMNNENTQDKMKDLDSLIEILKADDLRNIVGGLARPKGVIAE